MTTSIQDKMICSVCDAPLRRCPCCGEPFCDGHLATRELCADCAARVGTGVGRVKLALYVLLALLVVVGAVYAALADGSLISGLAGVAICTPVVLLLGELAGWIARPVLLARRRSQSAAADASGADALPEPSAASRD
jgi:hypothetical protein